MQAERCRQRTGSETPGGESPYSSLQKQDQKERKKKKSCSERRGEWRDEPRRAPRGLSHPSTSSGKRGCVWFVRGDSEARIRSMYALNADQSLTTPLGVGISV